MGGKGLASVIVRKYFLDDSWKLAIMSMAERTTFRNTKRRNETMIPITILHTLTVVPAYGRDYKSKQAAIDAWNDGHDFLIATYGMPSRYTSKYDDWKSDIRIRYHKAQRVALIPHKPKGV
jgi:hypothetical protein